MTFQKETGKQAYSLTELLVTLGIAGFLTAMGAVAWLIMAHSHDTKASLGTIMATLAQARASALASRSEVWVLFGKNGERTGLVSVRREGAIYPAANWSYLAPNTTFNVAESSAVTQPVPESVLMGLRKPAVIIWGGVMFLPNGRIPVPIGGGGQLSLSLTGHSGKTAGTRILLSRATGRATCL